MFFGITAAAHCISTADYALIIQSAHPQDPGALGFPRASQQTAVICISRSNPILMTPRGLQPPFASDMRDESYVRARSRYIKDRSGTAEQKIGWVNSTVFGWDQAGGKILTPRADDTLVLVPPLHKLDGFVHPSQGGPVFRELPYFKLQDPACAFHEDGKRTLNAFMQKAEGEIRTALDVRLLGLVFWLAAAEAIQRHEQGGEAEPEAA